MTDLHETRKRAYHYIMTQANKLNLDLNRRSDKTTSDVDCISLNDLVGLKEGRIDPTQHLVVVLKKLLKGVADEVKMLCEVSKCQDEMISKR